ncbi:MAG: LacI family DNA-binding transcriptional regulator [Chloroflexi bacterium]|nr:LacI family DNA-binding transcriptional regulator [Chloroflexota bacterium]
MATIKEVAAHAGVSVATVSRVVNNNGYVSEDLRQRVLEAMNILDYKPSALARSLRRQESLTVGLLMPGMNQPFFATLAYVIQKTLFASGYRVIICSSEESGEMEAAYVDMLIRQRVDGAIVVPTGHGSETIQPLLAKMPVVLVDRDLPDLEVSRILADNFQGGYEAMNHLLLLGHREIALIGSLLHLAAMDQRIAGAKKAYGDTGLPLDSLRVLMAGRSEFDLGYTSALDVLSGSIRPTAVFALTDVIAIGAMHAAAELGLRLPEDLSVIGFDDIPLASYIIPSLTTVAQPIQTMGANAAKLLLQRFKTGRSEPYEKIVHDMRLMIRASTTSLVRLRA